jgi:hypothetical protein
MSEFHDLDRRVAVLERIAQIQQLRTDLMSEFRAALAFMICSKAASAASSP